MKPSWDRWTDPQADTVGNSPPKPRFWNSEHKVPFAAGDACANQDPPGNGGRWGRALEGVKGKRRAAKLPHGVDGRDIPRPAVGSGNNHHPDRWGMSYRREQRHCSRGSGSCSWIHHALEEAYPSCPGCPAHRYSRHPASPRKPDDRLGSRRRLANRSNVRRRSASRATLALPPRAVVEQTLLAEVRGAMPSETSAPLATSPARRGRPRLLRWRPRMPAGSLGAGLGGLEPLRPPGRHAHRHGTREPPWRTIAWMGTRCRCRISG